MPMTRPETTKAEDARMFAPTMFCAMASVGE